MMRHSAGLCLCMQRPALCLYVPLHPEIDQVLPSALNLLPADEDIAALCKKGTGRYGRMRIELRLARFGSTAFDYFCQGCADTAALIVFVDVETVEIVAGPAGKADDYALYFGNPRFFAF